MITVCCAITSCIVQDQEPLVPARNSLCGGGLPQTFIQISDLPVAFHMTYQKDNGCRMRTFVNSNASCTPPTSSQSQQAKGISCLRGMITIPSPNLVGLLHIFNPSSESESDRPCLACDHVCLDCHVCPRCCSNGCMVRTVNNACISALAALAHVAHSSNHVINTIIGFNIRA